ncbi:O-antigen polysaccharide polymerase Wzy [Clostridium formicaceticum]|uniref:Oligosaccharide repeat unit polymerase n=1 Tax=Clostridium formicaceticum TaxID=1497 RepID=A0AAC9RI52_9CLOT|nr:O-antigen polysaccharide polymerase Wzy [Clostridium formicaceticum]AOY75606.1 hypothetical protein BJL90_06695 [Clostridium formicaceticum]ARE85915.1 hypothetical protein CLFO_02310 [Clostridium formicaceticum]
MLNSKRYSKVAILILVINVTILSFLSYLVFTANFSAYKDYSSTNFVLSWLGIILGIYVILTWYKLTDRIFSLYTIFMLFFFLFNYGQSLMWAFGIHHPRELGQTMLFAFPAPNSADIAYTQVFILISIATFHLGAIIFAYNEKRKYTPNISELNKQINSNDTTLKSIYYGCLLVSLIVVPITLYNSISNLMLARVYGYNAIYYGENIGGNLIFNLLEHMFFPSLIGLLLGSKYKINVKRIVYLIFSIYVLILVFSGDRGGWLYKFIILIWMSHIFYKPINVKHFLKYGVFSIVGVYILNAITAVRNIGINLDNIKNSFLAENSPIISAIFEMGVTMRPTTILLKKGWDVYPYGNTYVNAMLGIVSSRIFSLIGKPFSPLSTWFSQEYLGISYGAGFSIVAEALLNFGPIFAPVFMIFLGYIIVSITMVNNKKMLDQYPMKTFMAISTMSIIIHVVRNHFQWFVKVWFYGVFVLVIIIVFIKEFLKRKIIINPQK